jgi:hypothetical protein
MCSGFPTDAKLMHRARERLVRLARKTGVSLRQSYERVGKHALIAYQRYAHAKQFKRANRSLRTIRTYLGRVRRDLARKVRGEPELERILASDLWLAERVGERLQHRRECRRLRCPRRVETAFERFQNGGHGSGRGLPAPRRRAAPRPRDG